MLSALLSLLSLVHVQPVPVVPVAPSLCALQDKQPPKAEQEKQPADNRPEIKATLADFEKMIAAKGKQDDEAIQIVDKLLADWDNCGPKDRQAIVNSLAKSFDQRRIPVGENFDD